MSGKGKLRRRVYAKLGPGREDNIRQVIQSIYLYKPSESFLNTWVYYRVASISSGEPAGTFGAPIQVCRVEWPTFEDVSPATDTPGITGRASAYEHLCRQESA